MALVNMCIIIIIKITWRLCNFVSVYTGFIRYISLIICFKVISRTNVAVTFHEILVICVASYSVSNLGKIGLMFIALLGQNSHPNAVPRKTGACAKCN